MPFRAKFKMALYPDIFLICMLYVCVKFHASIIKRTIHIHIGWAICLPLCPSNPYRVFRKPVTTQTLTEDNSVLGEQSGRGTHGPVE